MKKSKPNTKYASVSDLIRLYPAFSDGQIRYYIRNSATNGFNKCMRRIGKNIFINISDFEKWIESHIEGGNNE